MKSRLRSISLTVLLVTIAAVSAPAQGTLSFSSLPGSVSVANGIFSESFGSVPFTVSHQGDAAEWFVTASRGNSSSFDPRLMQRRFLFFFTLSLNYNIFTPFGVIVRDLSGPIGAANVVAGSFGASGSVQTASSYLSVRIPPEQFVRSGTYTDSVEVSLYRGSVLTPESAVRVERRTVQISSTTSSVAQVALVESGGDASLGDGTLAMDFGPLAPGATRTADLVFRANRGYYLEAASANGGQLLNVNRPGGFTIPYTFRYDGSVVALGTGNTVLGLSFFTGTGINFARRPISVEIGSFASNVPSGLYEDVITFTISPF
jgi:spore coat protein U-like protein